MDRPIKLGMIKSLYFLVLLLLSSPAQDESQLKFLVVVSTVAACCFGMIIVCTLKQEPRQLLRLQPFTTPTTSIVITTLIRMPVIPFLKLGGCLYVKCAQDMRYPYPFTRIGLVSALTAATFSIPTPQKFVKKPESFL